MYQRATKAELLLFMGVVLFLSGAPMSLYVKLFAYEPPAPKVTLMLPVLVLMIFNMGLRMRSTLIGMIVAWPWVAFAALALVSTLWSVSPADTIRESAVMIVSVLYLAMIAGIADWTDIFARIWQVCIALIAFTLLLFVAMPDIGKMAEIYPGAMSGPWFEKNATGQFFLFAGLTNYALLMARPRRATAALVWTLICGVCLILTESTTALIAFVAGSAILGLVAVMRRGFAISIPASLLIVFAGLPLGVMIAGESGAILDTLGKSGTLTGRTPIWEALVDFSLHERPWLGHGYHAFWVQEYEFSSRAHIYDAIKYRAPHSHNTLLEARLDLGWVGTGLFLAAAAQLFIMSLLRLRSSTGAYLAIPASVALTLVSLVEVSPLSVSNLGGLIFVLCLAKMTLCPSHRDRKSGLWTYLDRLAERRLTETRPEPLGRPRPATA